MAVDSRSAPTVPRNLRWSLWADRVLTIGVRVVIVVGVVFLLLPLVAVVGASLNRPPALSFPPETVTLDSYRLIPPQVYDAFFVSLRLAIVASAFGVALALPGAFALGRGRIAGKNAIETVVRSPLQVPQIVIGVAAFQFYVVLSRSTDVVLQNQFGGLLIAHVLLVIPYMIGTMKARVDGLDPTLEEAATSLGASRVHTMFRVTLPLVRPAVLAAVTLAFIISFDNVPISLFLAGRDSTTLPVALFTAAEVSLSPWIYAAATLTIFFSLFFTWALERFVGLRTVLSV